MIQTLPTEPVTVCKFRDLATEPDPGLNLCQDDSPLDPERPGILQHPAEREAFLDDLIRICCPGPILVVGLGAPAIVQALLNRGIDTYGLETGAPVTERRKMSRCRPGSVRHLPFDDASFESVLVTKALACLSPEELDDALTELNRVTGRTLILQVQGDRATGLNVEESTGIRDAWDSKLVAHGFRKHPLRSLIVSYEALDHPASELLLIFERVADPAEVDPRSSDPSRETGGLSDARLAQYEVAAKTIRPWDRVLDLGCSSGYGTYWMQRLSRGSRFVGIDPSASALDYAASQFAPFSPTIEFHRALPLEYLKACPDNSFHFIFSHDEALVPSLPAEWRAEFQRVLTPGGRALISISGQSSAPSREAARAKEATDWASLVASNPEELLLESVYTLALPKASDSDDQPGSSRRLRIVSAEEAGSDDADWRLVLLMKDPIQQNVPPYEETVFSNLKETPHVSVQYSDFYRNPWIHHALMHASYRVTAPLVQIDCAWRLLLSEPPESLEAGAALCLLIYRLMDGQLPNSCSEDVILDKARAFLSLPETNPVHLRWQISVSSALGNLHLRRGQFEEAKALLARCTELDPLTFSVHLAGKTVEAWFWRGWLALSEGDNSLATEMWTKGVDFGDQILRRGIDETLMRADWPNLFDYGDGVRELVHALETVAMCANGLHCLRLQDQGISYRWDAIPNTFRGQFGNRERLLRQAQHRVAQLCSEIDTVRAELRERTRELDQLRLEKELSGTLNDTVNQLMNRV